MGAGVGWLIHWGLILAAAEREAVTDAQRAFYDGANAELFALTLAAMVGHGLRGEAWRF